MGLFRCSLMWVFLIGCVQAPTYEGKDVSCLVTSYCESKIGPEFACHVGLCVRVAPSITVESGGTVYPGSRVPLVGAVVVGGEDVTVQWRQVEGGEIDIAIADAAELSTSIWA